VSNRVLVIANRSFKADPLKAVLANPDARPSAITHPVQATWPRRPLAARHGSIEQRTHFALLGATIEVWCIQVHMNLSAEITAPNTALHVA